MAHCFVQVTLQAQAFSINQQAAQFIHSILLQGNATDSNGFNVLRGTDLRLCDNVPSTFSTASCRVLWNGTAPTDNVAAAQVSSINSTLQTILNNVTDSTTLSMTVSTSNSVVTSVLAVTSARATQPSSVQINTPTASKPNSDVDATAVGPTKTLTVIAITPTSIPNYVDTDEYQYDNVEFTTFHEVGTYCNLYR